MIEVHWIAFVFISIIGIGVGGRLTYFCLQMLGWRITPGATCFACDKELGPVALSHTRYVSHHFCNNRCAAKGARLTSPLVVDGHLEWMCYRCRTLSKDSHGWRHHNSAELGCLVCPTCFDCLERQAVGA